MPQLAPIISHTCESCFNKEENGQRTENTGSSTTKKVKRRKKDETEEDSWREKDIERKKEKDNKENRFIHVKYIRHLARICGQVDEFDFFLQKYIIIDKVFIFLPNNYALLKPKVQSINQAIDIVLKTITSRVTTNQSLTSPTCPPLPYSRS